MNMKNQTVFTPQDGLAYTIHLKKNGITIYNAVYHHCALSGQHYFTKGNEVYPIEDVYSHSDKGHEIKETKQILTDTYCGHVIEVTFTSVIPENTLTQIPESVYECILEQLQEDNVEGDFTEEETGDSIYIRKGEEDDDGKDIYTVVAGSWQIIPLDYNIISSIANWEYNYSSKEALTEELFKQYFGNLQGKHFYEKWIYTAKKNVLSMIHYFKESPDKGQIFCNMLMQQVKQYQIRQYGTKQ